MKKTIKVTLPSLTEQRLLFREKYDYVRRDNPWSSISQDDAPYEISFQYLEETYGDIYKLAEAKLFYVMEHKGKMDLTDMDRHLPFVSSKQCREFFEDTMYLDRPLCDFLELRLTSRNGIAGRKRFKKWLKHKWTRYRQSNK